MLLPVPPPYTLACVSARQRVVPVVRKVSEMIELMSQSLAMSNPAGVLEYTGQHSVGRNQTHTGCCRLGRPEQRTRVSESRSSDLGRSVAESSARGLAVEVAANAAVTSVEMECVNQGVNEICSPTGPGREFVMVA